MALNAGQEQRRHPRVSTEMPMRYRVIGEGGDIGERRKSKTTNIASEGFAFESPFTIPMTARLEIEIVLPGEEGRLTAEATVMRIARELPEGRGYEYGVAFDLDTLSNRKKLEIFVRSIDIVPLLKLMARHGATDLHLSNGCPPMLRVQRSLEAAPKERPMTSERVEALVYGTMNTERRRKLETDKEIDFPFMLPEVGRWRVNVYYQKGHVEATFHTIDLYIPSIAELGFPDSVRGMALAGSGLIIVCGGSASGKSTTIASMIGAINNQQNRAVITIEDPIEYIHENDRAVIKQREVGSDVTSTYRGVKNIMRQDPDVIVVENVEDAETLSILLRAAESGRLVIISLSAQDAVDAVNRLASMYPREKRHHALHMIAGAMRACIAQWLLPTIDSSGQALASEILVMSDGIRNAIWMDKLEQMVSLMPSVNGARSLDASLRHLIMRGIITFDTASQIARDPDGLRRNIAV